MGSNNSSGERTLGWVLLVAVAYFAAARLCQELPVRDGQLTALWLPSGVALAALITRGRWMIVGVALGDVATSLVGGFGILPALGFALGDSLEALVASALILQVTRRGHLQEVRQVALLVPITALACAISASVGTLVLHQTGFLNGTSPWDAWRLYWSSTATGIILLGPAILAWRRHDGIAHAFLRSTHPHRVVAEATALAGLLVVVCALVFVDRSIELLGLFLTFPLLTWATVRFGQQGATSAVLVVAAFGVWGVAREALTFAGMSTAQVVEVLQLLLAVVLLSSLVLAIVLAERDDARANVEDLLSVFGHSLQLSHVGSWQLRLRPRDEPTPGDADAELDQASDRVPSASLGEVVRALGRGHEHEAGVDVWYSRELATILGVDPESRRMPLAQMLAMVVPTDRARLVAAVRGAISLGEPYRLEHGVVRASDGTRRVLRHIGTVVDRDDPGGARIVGSVLDVTDQHEVSMLKDSLVATASHELRTPLTSVLGFATTLGRSWDDIPEGERLRYLRIIEQQAERLVAIVDDTLQQARLDQRTLTVHREPLNVGTHVVAALRELEVDPADVVVDGSCDVDVLADREHFVRVITNLVSNARKYGRSPIIISCERRADPGDATGSFAIRVVDHGTGVSPDFEERMFDRFTRGPDTVHAQGTGLGLSIVQGLVRAMHGTIAYAHRGGQTTFEVVLPAAASGRGGPLDIAASWQAPADSA